MENGKCSCMCLRPISLGLALGVLSGLAMMVFAMVAWKLGYGSGMMLLYGTLYPGYTASLLGSLMGLAWGFLHGFVCGLLLAWFYNLSLCCSSCHGCCKKQ